MPVGESTISVAMQPVPLGVLQGLNKDNSGIVPRLNSAQFPFVHPNLSTETGLSRCLVIGKPGAALRGVDVETFVMVSENLLVRRLEADKTKKSMRAGLPYHGTWQIHQYAEKVFVRFSDIRDSCSVASSLLAKRRDWTVKPISPREFTLVSSDRPSMLPMR